MIVANVVIQTLPGRAPGVALRIKNVPGLGPLQLDGDHRLAGLWWLPEGGNPEGLSEALQAMDPDIVAVFPTIVDMKES